MNKYIPADPYHGGSLKTSPSMMQNETGKPVSFEKMMRPFRNEITQGLYDTAGMLSYNPPAGIVE